MELVHKYLLKEVFLSHEDGSVYQGYWKLCVEGTRESIEAWERFKRRLEAVHTWHYLTKTSSYFLWWCVLT